MESWFEFKARAVLGPEEKDDKEVVMLGRMVKWNEEGIHRAKPAMVNRDREDKVEEWAEEYLVKGEAAEFRGLAA
eukprot:7231246-Karenia_brevis.AAC.1